MKSVLQRQQLQDYIQSLLFLPHECKLLQGFQTPSQGQNQLTWWAHAHQSKGSGVSDHDARFGDCGKSRGHLWFGKGSSVGKSTQDINLFYTCHIKCLYSSMYRYTPVNQVTSPVQHFTILEK